MLTFTEREQLKSRRNLKPKVRANLDYRVAHKLKIKLQELNEINEALRLLPEKNARRVLNDEVIASALMLAETMVKIAGYAPVEPIPGRKPVVRIREHLESKDPKLKKTMEIERPATDDDIARCMLLRDHIEVLQKCIGPFAAPLDGSSVKLPYPNTPILEEGYKRFRELRPDPSDRC